MGLDAAPVGAVGALTEFLGGKPASTLIGGGCAAPDRAAFYNVSLSRDLDIMRSYLATGETNHPPDNLGAVLAAAESVSSSGRDFLIRTRGALALEESGVSAGPQGRRTRALLARF